MKKKLLLIEAAACESGVTLRKALRGGLIVKRKKAPIGTRRVWGTTPMVRTAEGWKPEASAKAGEAQKPKTQVVGGRVQYQDPKGTWRTGGVARTSAKKPKAAKTPAPKTPEEPQKPTKHAKDLVHRLTEAVGELRAGRKPPKSGTVDFAEWLLTGSPKQRVFASMVDDILANLNYVSKDIFDLLCARMEEED